MMARYGLTQAEAEEFLEQWEDAIQDGMTERGWDIIDDLATGEGYEERVDWQDDL